MKSSRSVLVVALVVTASAYAAPLADRDGDRIADAEDKCPDAPETYNGIADDDGCPDAFERFGGVEVPPSCAPSDSVDTEAQRLGTREGLTFFRVTGQAPSPSGGDGAHEIVVRLPRRIRARKKLGLRLAFVNRAREPLVVMHPMDGTLGRTRYPHYDVYVRDLRQDRVYRLGATGLCGFNNPLTRDDFLVVAPNTEAEVNLGWLEPSAIRLPAGSYALWVVYRFCGYYRTSPDPSPLERKDAFVGALVSRAQRIDVAK